MHCNNILVSIPLFVSLWAKFSLLGIQMILLISIDSTSAMSILKLAFFLNFLCRPQTFIQRFIVYIYPKIGTLLFLNNVFEIPCIIQSIIQARVSALSVLDTFLPSLLENHYNGQTFSPADRKTKCPLALDTSSGKFPYEASLNTLSWNLLNEPSLG